MSVMKLSKPKSHLKNKCTIIKINDNGYPKENNYEKIFSQSHSTRNEKRFLLKQSTLSPSFQIINKKKLLENIEKGKYEIESFDELFRKEKFRQSVKIESYKKKPFDNIIFDYILNNYKNQNPVGIIKLLKLKAYKIFLKDFPAANIFCNFLFISLYDSANQIIMNYFCFRKIINYSIRGLGLLYFNRKFFKPALGILLPCRLPFQPLLSNSFGHKFFCLFLGLMTET